MPDQLIIKFDCNLRLRTEIFLRKKNRILNLFEKIDFRIISHPQRILTDMSLYNNFKQKIIMPISSIPKQIKKLIKGPKILDYAMTVQEGRFLIKDQYCIIPVSLAIAYALSVLTAGNVKKYI